MQDYVVLFNVRRGDAIDEHYVWQGVRGIFYEHDSLELFLKGVSAILTGELWLPRALMTKCILNSKGECKSPQEGNPILSRREVEILAHVAVGARNEDIADRFERVWSKL